MVVTDIRKGAQCRREITVCGNKIVNDVLGKVTAPGIIRHVRHCVFRKRFRDFITRKQRKSRPKRISDYNIGLNPTILLTPKIQDVPAPPQLQ